MPQRAACSTTGRDRFTDSQNSSDTDSENIPKHKKRAFRSTIPWVLPHPRESAGITLCARSLVGVKTFCSQSSSVSAGGIELSFNTSCSDQVRKIPWAKLHSRIAPVSLHSGPCGDTSSIIIWIASFRCTTANLSENSLSAPLIP